MTLERLENQLNPHLFFRANRQCIVSKQAVKFAGTTTNRKLKLNLIPEHSSEILVSKLKVSLFKKWIRNQ